MKLESRFLLIFTIAILLFVIFGLLIQYFVIIPAIEKVESTIVKDDYDRCIKALQDEIIHLTDINNDWAQWDDTYKFIENKNENYIKSNLNILTFTNNHLYSIQFFNSSNELVWGGYINDKKQVQKINDIGNLFPKNIIKLLNLSNSSSLTGYLAGSKGLFIISLIPILNSDRGGERKGTLVMSRKMNELFIDEIESRVSIEFQLRKNDILDFSKLKPLYYLDKSQDHIVVNDYLKTLIQKNYILLHVKIPRDLFNRSIDILSNVQYFILIMGLVLLLVLLFVLNRTVTRPISKFAAKISELQLSKNSSNDFSSDRKDEIGILSNKFNRLLNKLQNINQNLECIVDERTEEIKRTHDEIIFRLAMAIENRDTDTGEHIKRIDDMTVLFCDKIGIESEDCIKYGLASTMHDIGKIGIPDSILNKPDKLTENEFSLMKKHCNIGSNILDGSKIDILNIAKEIALNHHERWDGKGYPTGLKGDNIPLSARIVSLVDVYDALSFQRVYKKAWPLEKIIQFLQESKGGIFDPELVDLFLEHIAKFEAIIAKYKQK